MKLKIALAIAAIALFCLVGWNSKAQSSSRDPWEYKVITQYGSTVTMPVNMNELNNAGAEGWELVTVLSEGEVTRGNLKQIKVSYFFKRRSN